MSDLDFGVDEGGEQDDMYNFTAEDDPGGYNPPPAEVPIQASEGSFISEDESALLKPNVAQAARPMTAVNATGYGQAKKRGGINPDGVPGGQVVRPLKRRSDDSPEYKAVEMERLVNKLYERSAVDHMKGNYMLALEKAKESLKREINLCRFQEEINITEHNIDLTFAVNYNTAQMYYANGMFTESLEAFKKIVKNKAFIQLGGGRLRVNIGNIYFEQGKYEEAAKNYKMAVDQILPENHKDMRAHVLNNIGICYFKLQQYSMSAENFEQAFDLNGGIAGCYNLVLCYYALNNRKNMKKSFYKLLTAQIPGLLEDEDLDDEKAVADELVEYLKEKRRDFFTLILKAARLIADHIEPTWEKGYDFLIDKLKAFQLKYETCDLADEMQMEKALKYLRNKQFEQAIKSLKAFEKKGKKLQSRAATNLSFIYILEGNLKLADKYAKLAIEVNAEYNAKALVNQGICFFLLKKYRDAKDCFSRALLAEPDCIEAIYNIALVDKIELRYKEALRTFQRLTQFIPDSIEVIYQIADIFEKLDDLDNANDWYNRLITRVPSDPTALFKLGSLYEKENDEANSFNYFLESHKYYPVNLEVVKKIGFYFVQNDIYEKALSYFERASQIKPKEVEWKLYVGSCLRRIGQYRKAYACYKKIHKNFPQNLECLDYLIQICGELGMEQEKNQYDERKKKIEKKLEKMEKKRVKIAHEQVKEEKPEEDVNDLLRQRQAAEQQRLADEAQRMKEVRKKKKKATVQENLPEDINSPKFAPRHGAEPAPYREVNDMDVGTEDADELGDLDGLEFVESMFS